MSDALSQPRNLRGGGAHHVFSPQRRRSRAIDHNPAREIMGVRVLDHIIIGKGHYVSLVDDGYW
jgi:hypothetical protein